MKFLRTFGESCRVDYPVQGDYVCVTDHLSNPGILLSVDEALDLQSALQDFFYHYDKNAFKED